MTPKQFFKTCLLSTAFLFAASPNSTSQSTRTPAVTTVDTLPTLAATPAPLALPAVDTKAIFDSRGKTLADNNRKYASIVMDAATGEVIMGTNIDKKLHPASVAKILTAYLVFEAVEAGQLSLDQKITFSAHAAGMEASHLNVKPGTTITLDQAIKILMVKSANDVAAALAETVSGTHGKFVDLMNQTCTDLGMDDSKFVNANGLPYDLDKDRAVNSVTSVRDMAVLMKVFMDKYPQYYSYMGQTKASYNGVTMNNHNKLLPGVKLKPKDTTKPYKGMDGGKTGYTMASGCNIVCSATRQTSEIDYARLIVVSFGHKTGKERVADTRRLFDQGFLRLQKNLEMKPQDFKQVATEKMANPVIGTAPNGGFFGTQPPKTHVFPGLSTHKL